jgi:hypothetical protein
MLTNFLPAVDFVFDLQMGNSSFNCAEQLVGREADGRHVVGPEIKFAISTSLVLVYFKQK